VLPDSPVNRRSPRSATAPTSPGGLPTHAHGAKRAPASPGGARATGFDRAALRERLLAGLAELGLDATLADRLLDYLALLVKWNGVYNLTAVREPAAMLRQHLLDSLSIVAPLAARLAQRDGAPAGRIVDVGSGAGLPGIVLALAWPRADVVLVEPVGKKAAFLRQCQGELALTNLHVEATRVESLGAPEAGQAPDLVVCRAFASLADFATAIDRLVGPHTLIAAMKGAAPDDEIAALPADWAVTEVLPLRVPDLDVTRHLVLMRRRP
jgi:16S rRNA (guanine527-N7)-methyltransferase